MLPLILLYSSHSSSYKYNSPYNFPCAFTMEGIRDWISLKTGSLDKAIQEFLSMYYCIIKSTVHSLITYFNLDLNFTSIFF